MQPLTPMELQLFAKNADGLLELIQQPEVDFDDELVFTAVIPYYLALEPMAA